MITKDINPIVRNFVSHLKSKINYKNSIYFNHSDFFLFYDSESINEKKDTIIDEKPFDQNDFENSFKKNFDLIIGDFPIGLRRVEWKVGDYTKKMRHNLGLIYSAANHLTENGIGVFGLEPILWSSEWEKFNEHLNHSGLFVNGIINTPPNTLHPYTSLRIMLMLMSKTAENKLFIAELDDSSGIPDIIDNYLQNNSTGTLERGLLTDIEEFIGFDNFRFRKEIEKLKTNYEEYDEYRLIDVAEEITLGKHNQTFEDKENAIYLPKVGNSKVIWDLKHATLKHQNYFQIVLIQSVVINKYTALFYSSDLGRTIIKSLFVGGTIPNITKQSLEQAVIAIPTFEEQNLIINTYEKIERLKEEVESISNELSINPKNANILQEKVDELLKDLSGLTDSDKVKAIIRKGESKTREYKQTLSLDVRKKTKEKYIEGSVLKTIVAFLNTDGGDLLIGVKDSGEITGIELEIPKLYKNKDKYLLQVKNLIKRSIGEGFYPLIDYRLVDVNDKKVLLVECQESDTPCYLNGKEFFVRTNPATDKLEGPELVEYIKRHFDK